MTKRRYSYQIRFDDKGGHWDIVDMGDKGYGSFSDPVVWSMPHLEDHWTLGEPPIEFRQKYEQMLRDSGWQPEPEPAVNLVEMIADQADCAFDQPCFYGHRIETHAVYCHNESWLYSPRKCRRRQAASWINQTPWPHEECPGYRPNTRAH